MNTLAVLRVAAARLCATLILVVPPIGFVLGGTWISRELSIDRCLDRGGRWDRAAGTCDTGISPRSEADQVQ